MSDPIQPHDPGATMAVNAKTGASKQKKLAQFDLIPARVLTQLAELYGKGASEGFYAPRNWEGGYEWSLSFAAAQRHMWQFWEGEDNDPATGLPHVVHAAWHCFAMAHFMNNPDKYSEMDDRA